MALELIFNLFLMVFCIVCFVNVGTTMPQSAANELGAEQWPQVILVLMMLAICWNLVKYFRTNKLEDIAAAIASVRRSGVDLVLCTGGMSVDPDDRTPGAIRRSGARIVTYGAPVLPGAMFLLGYYGDGTPVMGLPGCVMYPKATIFDLILPRIAAGVPVTREDIASMGEGGLCLGCGACTYPNCGFGK